MLTRKFFYLFTCEYCFSHYVTLIMLLITGYKLLMPGWQGYIISGFSLVSIANVYMSLYAFLKTDIKREKAETVLVEKESVTK